MKYELNQECIDKYAQPLSELLGVMYYLAYAGHPHTSASVTNTQVRLEIYCDTIPEIYAVLDVTKKNFKSKWNRFIHRGTLSEGDRFYCIHYAYTFND